MKKILTILLVAVLAVGFAFAGFTGSASISAGYNLDDQKWGFVNGKDLDVDWSLNLDAGDVGSTGEGDIKAEIAGSFSVDLAYANDSAATDIDAKAGLTYELVFKISVANIHFGEDLVVGILNAGGGYSYAASYWKDTTTKKVINSVTLGSAMVPGFTVTYKDYTAGFGMTGDADAKTYKFFGQAQTPSYTLAEGLTLQAAAYGYLADNDKAAGASVKGAYASDAFTADLGVDFVYDGGAKIEAALNAAYAPVTLNVYFCNQNINNLSAKLAAEVGNIEVSVEGRSLLDIDGVAVQPRWVKASVTGTFDAIEANVYAKATFAAKTYGFGGYVQYSADKFVVYGGADLALAAATDPAKLTEIKPTLTVTSDALINNATLELAWADANFADADATDDYKATKLGAITASCTIAF